MTGIDIHSGLTMDYHSLKLPTPKNTTFLPTMKGIFITLLVCVGIYEIFEHVILPLFWTIRYRKRKPAYGPSGMIGKKCGLRSGKVPVVRYRWGASCGIHQ